ncbi:ATP-binding cassette domain-containing protein, partial [Mycobacterium tuberculosis]|nr:ATP-binding cassette domain-containing protein [Mycobacterium tuberculosis]
MTLDALTAVYGDSKAVDSLTLEIGKGELIALLGPSGCGKTTTLRMIAGFVPPYSGRVVLGDADITRRPVHRRNIGVVFQSYALFPHLTALDNIGFGLRMRGLPKTEVVERAAAALELVGLRGFAERYPGALSGGQQQRVALARALVIEPDVLLL